MDHNIKPGARVTYSNPEVLDGKPLKGELELDGMNLVFIPAHHHHQELMDNGFDEPEYGLQVVNGWGDIPTHLLHQTNTLANIQLEE